MSDRVYANYWARKQLRAQTPRFPVVRWWVTEDLCENERVIFAAVRGAGALLDIGAGDLRVMRKFRRAGFAGEYHTQDVGTEHPHTYADLADVKRTYDAVLCMDVVEHLPLAAGLALLDRAAGLLNPGGVLVVQTPNARCIRSPWAGDMTHLHLYNLPDLWAYFRAAGYDADGYLVRFTRTDLTWKDRLTERIRSYAVPKFLLMDCEENIQLLVRRPKGSGPSPPGQVQ